MEKIPWDDAMWDFQMAKVENEVQLEQMKREQAKRR